LGLKPLNINEKIEEEEDDGTKEGTLIPGDRNKTRHLPAEHWGEKAKSAKLRLVTRPGICLLNTGERRLNQPSSG
jgi:hypothetical protein